jgi:type IV pilus assembly protein PilM
MFFKKKGTIGLDIGSGWIKMVRLVDSKEGYLLDLFDMVQTPPGIFEDGVITDKTSMIVALQQLLKKTGVNGGDAVIGVSGHSSVIIKRINLPMMTDDELGTSIRYEAEQYIPFDINDVNIDFQILGPKQDEEGQMDVMLVAVKKNVVNSLVEVVEQAGLDTVIVDVDSFALSNMYEVNYDAAERRIAALVNVGASNININVLLDGVPVFTRDSSKGSNYHTESLMSELSVSREDAELLKMGRAVDGVDPLSAQSVIDAASEEIYGEISNSFEYFRSSVGYEDIDGIILSGGAATIKGFRETMAERLGIGVTAADPFNGFNVSEKLDQAFLSEMAPMAAVAVGLALRREDDR